MKKKIWNDYIKSFRWSQICKIYSNGNSLTFFFYVFYMLTMPFIVGNAEDNSNPVDYMGYLVLVISLAFVILNASVVAIRLPKQMYLIPMSRSQREEYLQGLLKLKLVVPMVLSGSIIVIYCGIVGMPTVFTIMNLVGICSCAICGAITSWPDSVWHRNDGMSQEKKMKRVADERLEKLPVFSSLGVVFGALEVLFSIFIEIDDYEKFGLRIGMGLLVGFLLIMDVIVLRYAKPVIEVAADYEKTCSVDLVLGEE